MTDRDAAPGSPSAPDIDNSIRGWQLLAEKRGQEADAIRSERDSLAARLADLEGSAKARQLAEDYPDASELFLRNGAERIRPEDEPVLAQLQAAITAYEPRIDANSPRRRPPTPAPATREDLARAIRTFPEGEAW